MGLYIYVYSLIIFHGVLIFLSTTITQWLPSMGVIFNAYTCVYAYFGVQLWQDKTVMATTMPTHILTNKHTLQGLHGLEGNAAYSAHFFIQ